VKVAADAPAVPSFRAVASDRPSILSRLQSSPPAAEADQTGTPKAHAVAETSPATEAPVPSPPPLAQPVAASIDVEAQEAERFDDEALRAQFLAASGAAPTEASGGGVGRWWRAAALVALVIAVGEGAFIAWRFASSPAGLTGSRGTMSIESKPTGAQVKIDGEVRGVTPLSLSLAAGAHVIEISAGGEPRVLPVTLAACSTLSQYIELSSVSALGRIAVQSTPVGATILLDGQPRGLTPIELPDVSAGEHELVLDYNGQRVRQTVTVAAGTTTTVALPIQGSAVEMAGLMPAAVPTTGTVLVQAPFEMEVFENGRRLGLTGTRLTLAPGRYLLEIVSDTLAFRTEARVEVVAGRNSRLPVALPKGTVHLNAAPWAEVWVDGTKVGETPIGNLSLPIGPHEIVFKHPDLGEQLHAATVTAAAPLRLSVDMTRKP
jgi:hypothetical protein